MLKNLSHPVSTILEVTCPVINSCVTEVFKLVLTPLRMLTDSGQEDPNTQTAISEEVKQSHKEQEPPILAKVPEKVEKRSVKKGKKEPSLMEPQPPMFEDLLEGLSNRPSKAGKSKQSHVESEPPIVAKARKELEKRLAKKGKKEPSLIESQPPIFEDLQNGLSSRPSKSGKAKKTPNRTRATRIRRGAQGK